MDPVKIASRSHMDKGNGHCACGELLKDCWWMAVYYPYMEQCEQAKWYELLDKPPCPYCGTATDPTKSVKWTRSR